VISRDVARELRRLGVRWQPRPGDRFIVDEPEMVDSVFWVSDFTIEMHEYGTEKVLGFNGTTEWALDSVPVEQCLWLPREDQLRELLGAMLVRLERDDQAWAVSWRLESSEHRTIAGEVDEAYAAALVAALR